MQGTEEPQNSPPQSVPVEHPKSDRVRRRTCIACCRVIPSRMMTTLTKRAEKQEKWIEILSNGDKNFADLIRHKIGTTKYSVRYICFDHFEPDQLLFRNGSVEIMRTSMPSPYYKETFIENRYADIFSSSNTNCQVSASPSPSIKSPSPSSNEQPKVAEGFDEKMMEYLVSAANYYIEGAMRSCS